MEGRRWWIFPLLRSEILNTPLCVTIYEAFLGKTRVCRDDDFIFGESMKKCCRRFGVHVSCRSVTVKSRKVKSVSRDLVLTDAVADPGFHGGGVWSLPSPLLPFLLPLPPFPPFPSLPPLRSRPP